jgi:hypothetical protein
MPIIKQQILKGDYDTIRSVEVIPSGMALTIKATLKNANYDLEANETITFTTPTENQNIIVFLIRDAQEQVEIVFSSGDIVVQAGSELVSHICWFTLTPTTTDLENVDITALEVV